MSCTAEAKANTARELPVFPTARSVNAALRCPSRTTYGIDLDGCRRRIFRYRGVSASRDYPEGRTATGWVRLRTVETI